MMPCEEKLALSRARVMKKEEQRAEGRQRKDSRAEKNILNNIYVFIDDSQ